MSGLVAQHIVDCDIVPLVPSDCSIKEHREGGQFLLDMSKIRLHLSRNQVKGISIKRGELRKELASEPVLNANVLDYLFQHQELIPKEWRYDADGLTRQISFWGTVYRHHSDCLFVRTLCWNGSKWDWGYCWLHLVCSNQSPASILAS